MPSSVPPYPLIRRCLAAFLVMVWLPSRWFTHVEYFGAITQGKENDTSAQFVDFGLHHLFTPNIEAGAIVAFGPHPGELNLVTNVGIGVRF